VEVTNLPWLKDKGVYLTPFLPFHTQSWIRARGRSRAFSSPSDFERALKREELLLVTFAAAEDGLGARLKAAADELETVYGAASAEVTDAALAASLGVDAFPDVVLFVRGRPNRFPAANEKLLGEDVALEVVLWAKEKVEAAERVVFKAVEAAEFKSRPDAFKNVGKSPRTPM